MTELIEALESQYEDTVLGDYQEFVDKCISPFVQAESYKVQVLWAVAGLHAEAGELSELFEKAIRKGKNIDDLFDPIKDEIGDVLWYLTSVASLCGITLDEVMERNIEKLTERKNNGK